MAPDDLLGRLQSAVNARDLDAVVACFAADYRNETPVHPARGFAGHDQVRSNWKRVFAGIPDVVARILRSAVDGDVVWSEWELGGTRPDGAPQLLRGVIIFGVADHRFAWSRFYLEPVDQTDGSVHSAVSKIVGTEQ